MTDTQDNVSYASPHQEKANGVVSRNVLWAAGVGLFPIPVVDFVGLTAVQLKMIHELSELYEVPFRKDLGKSIIAGLIASVGAPALAFGSAGALLRGLPVIGPALGFFALPGFAGALTYAVGKTFTQHFETGGNMLDFDVAGMREHFAKHYAAGQQQFNNPQPADATT
ncbi:YcjF family protein [Acanthopleuribacter pedis]|uniref:DUF697 domain-containing protein n=1 Tax=Acanthopleuribacter pedis TaxID=442870 RepID=A0A8J7U3J2_9BACT|nr:DUF697 domain-containing protein [Acanthopleuribacter pedis]MBO1318809.1 DUF697 domain-containing protein [Acanthopleuribacter pedis]